MVHGRGTDWPVMRRLRWLRRQVILSSLSGTVFLFFGLAGVALFLISRFFLSGWLLLGAALPPLFLFFWWFRDAGIKRLGYRVERFFPSLQGRLVAGLELARYQGGKEGYSLELRDAALAQVEEIFLPLRLAMVVPWRRVWWCLIGGFSGLAILGTYWLVAPRRAEFGIVNGIFPSRLKVEMAVSPGDTAVRAGTELALSCRVKPGGIFSLVRMEMTGGIRGRRILPLSGESCGVMVKVEDGFAYRFSLLGRDSRWFQVSLLEPLTLRRVVWTVQPPEYTGLPRTSHTGEELLVLKGSVVDFAGEANQAVGGGRIIFGGDSARVVVDPSEPRRFSGRLVVMESGELRLELVPAAGGGFQTVSRVPVRVVADESPLVRVFLPGRDVDLPMEMRVLLGINSIDDYGLGELWLHYGKEEIDRSVRLKSLAGKKEDTTFYVWELADAGMLPGEVMRYYLRVTDNDRVLGPKSGRSGVFTVRFPTMGEIYSRAVEQAERTGQELGTLPAEQMKVGEALARLGEEAKKNRELSWEERRQLEEVVTEQEKLLERLSMVQEEVRRKGEELLAGMTWDPETFGALQQLEELLNRLLSPQLQAALRELQERLGERVGEIRPALERLQAEQEKLQEALERALELLKRIMEEWRLEALARTAEELGREEEKVAAAVSEDSLGRAVARQEAINAALDSMAAAMEELANEFSEPEIADSLKTLREEMESEGLLDRASNLAEQLKAGRRQEAKNESEWMAGGFKRLGERLNSLSEQLKRKRSVAVLEQLLASADGLIAISRAQEQLEERLKQGSLPAQLAPEQAGLGEATGLVAESLASLGARTLRVLPELGQELARILNAMQGAGGALAEGRGGAAAEQMRSARQGLNRAVTMVLSAAEQEARQGGGMKGGLESLLEQLAKMSAEQMAINAGMSGIPIPIPVSGLTPEQRQQLLSLLAQQQALRQELEKLLQSMGGERPGLTGSLEQLVDEMKAVERALSELQIDRILIERQEGILSRLLDAQRSLRQQGFKEERQAQTAREYQIEASPVLPADRGERNRFLREELLRALRQGYPAEYERLIRSYFERLMWE